MSRKKKSTTENMMDLVALLPWWGALLLALMGYVIFDRISRIAPGTLVAGESAAFMQRTIIISFAYALKIAFPLICIIAAMISFARRRQRGALFAEAKSTSGRSISDMSWRDFEAFVGEVFRREGYTVAENFDAGADGGIDLVLKKDGQLTLVQCKHWKAFRVGVPVVRELVGVMTAHGAHAGVLVTSGAFTEEAVQFARRCNVSLWDGGMLRAHLQRINVQTPLGPIVAPSTESAAPCPRCGAAMVKRVAKQGAQAGRAFLGCSTFPKCKGTRAI